MYFFDLVEVDVEGVVAVFVGTAAVIVFLVDDAVELENPKIILCLY